MLFFKKNWSTFLFCYLDSFLSSNCCFPISKYYHSIIVCNGRLLFETSDHFLWARIIVWLLPSDLSGVEPLLPALLPPLSQPTALRLLPGVAPPLLHLLLLLLDPVQQRCLVPFEPSCTWTSDRGSLLPLLLPSPPSQLTILSHSSHEGDNLTIVLMRRFLLTTLMAIMTIFTARCRPLSSSATTPSTASHSAGHFPPSSSSSSFLRFSSPSYL